MGIYGGVHTHQHARVACCPHMRYYDHQNIVFIMIDGPHESTRIK